MRLKEGTASSLGKRKLDVVAYWLTTTEVIRDWPILVSSVV